MPTPLDILVWVSAGCLTLLILLITYSVVVGFFRASSRKRNPKRHPIFNDKV